VTIEAAVVIACKEHASLFVQKHPACKVYCPDPRQSPSRVNMTGRPVNNPENKLQGVTSEEAGLQRAEGAELIRHSGIFDHCQLMCVGGVGWRTDFYIRLFTAPQHYGKR